MNLAFTDLDGIINSGNLEDTTITRIPNTFDSYEPLLCKNLNTFINKYNFKVVLSTAWRNFYEMDELKFFFKEYLKIDCEIIDKTSNDRLDPTYYSDSQWDPNRLPRERGLQITQWLETNKHLQVDQYIVIDDSIDAGYGHDKNFFRVDNEVGFDLKHLDMACKFWENLNEN